MYNFLGKDDIDNNFRSYQNVINVATNAHLDLINFRGTELQIDDSFGSLDFSNKKSKILVTFHSGSYNMPISHFLTKGHTIYILSDNRSVKLNDYLVTAELYRQKFNNNCDSVMLNVEEEGFIFKLRSKIKEGVPILAFIDGNKGVDGLSKENKNMLEIPFLCGKVKVRKGLPYMSYLMDIPLVLALTYKENGKHHLKVYEPICKSRDEDRDSFCMRAIRTIFSLFQAHLELYPDQWASWPYLHNWADVTTFNPSANSSSKPIQKSVPFIPILNDRRFIPLKMNGEFLLFDKKKYSAFSIDAEDAPLFSTKTTSSDKSKLLEDLINKDKKKVEYFCKMGILELC